MARILIMATHGSEDPTRAGLAFLFAKGAVEAHGSRPRKRRSSWLMSTGR